MKTMNYSLIRILFALVIGLVLVLWPNTAASYIVITIGVAFLIPGVISLFSFFGRKRSEHELAPRFPIEGIGSLLFGLWLIVMPEFFADVLMFLLGFILIMGGVQQIASLSMARRWTPVPGAFYLVPALILIAGIVGGFPSLHAFHSIPLAPSRVIMLGHVRRIPVSLIGSCASNVILCSAAVSTTF